MYIERIITLKNTDHRLVLSCDGINFSPIIKDRFEKDEVEAVLDYMTNSEEIDAKAVNYSLKPHRLAGAASSTRHSTVSCCF